MRSVSLCLLVSLSACRPEVSDGDGPILVGIEQDGRLHGSDGGPIRLRRAPFALLVRLSPEGTVHVNASERPDTVRALQGSDDFDDIVGFHDTGMAESDGNPERELIVSADSSHYWDADRFDAAPRARIGRRSVSRVWFLGEEGRVDMADYPHPSLHLALAYGVRRDTQRPPTPGLEVWKGYVRVALRKQGVRIDFEDR